MPLLEQAFQTAEACRLAYPGQDWLHLVRLTWCPPVCQACSNTAVMKAALRDPILHVCSSFSLRLGCIRSVMVFRRRGSSALPQLICHCDATCCRQASAH